MAKRKREISPEKQNYLKELKRLKDRIRYWEQVKRAKFTDIPKKGSQSYTKAAERLRKIQWSNFTEEQKREYRTNYDIAYENGEYSSKDKYKLFTPPSENDFYNNNPFTPSNTWQETPNEPADERIEYDLECDRLIDTILQEGVPEKDGQAAREYMRERLRILLEDSKQRLGDRAFYNYLKSGALAELQRIADDAIFKYLKRFEEQPTTDYLTSQFATVLNMGRPLDDEQGYTLQMEGHVDFRYDDDEFDY